MFTLFTKKKPAALKTVDGVLTSLTESIQELEKVRHGHRARANERDVAADVAREEARLAREEADRADKVQERLNALIAA